MMKELYSYEIELKETVLKKVKEEKRKKNKETGKFEKIQVEVEKEVEETHDYQFIIKSPSRKEQRAAEIFYSIKVNSYIKEGILTQKQISNQYINNGGLLDENENDIAFNSLVELDQIRRDLEELGGPEPESGESESGETEEGGNKEKLLKKQRELYNKLYDLELQKDAIFANSADTLARSALIEWWILNLTYYRSSKDEEYKPYFSDGSYEEKYELLCVLEDADNELYTDAITTAAQVVTLWVTSGPEGIKHLQEIEEVDS